MSKNRPKPAAALCFSGALGIQVPMGQYHTLVCLEDGSVVFEAKDGAYEPISPADIL